MRYYIIIETDRKIAEIYSTKIDISGKIGISYDKISRHLRLENHFITEKYQIFVADGINLNANLQKKSKSNGKRTQYLKKLKQQQEY